MKRLELLDTALTMLADKTEIEQIRHPTEPNLFTSLDQVLGAMQTKFDMEFLRGERNGQSESQAESKFETGTRPRFRL